MPKYPPNRLPLSVPKQYFELRRGGLKGAATASHVGVSTSCGSVWFIKAGRMLLPDEPIDERYLTQDDRIAIAEGLLAGRTASAIAGEIAKHRSTVYREISRGRGPDGTYNPWWSHNQASCVDAARNSRNSMPIPSYVTSSTPSSKSAGHRSGSPGTWPAPGPDSRR